MIAELIGAILIGLSLGIFGSGGSILTVPVLVYLAGQDPKLAIAGSLLVVGTISLITSLLNLRQGNISWRHVTWLGLPGIAGTFAGAVSATLVSGSVQLLCFSGLMLLAVSFMWRSKPVSAEPQSPPHNALLIIQGSVIGVLTGFVGVGGGFLLVPALVLLGRLDFSRAAATSLVIIFINSTVGFIQYHHVLAQQSLQLDWTVLALLATFGVGGSLAGQKLAKRLPKAKLQKGFAIFLMIIALFILYQTLPPLLEA
ncbi:sulfite exporter TauE/SafE family protein [Alteromonadaceae bacterium BrNp21-10]|nr:sulfite exporter TauE/SafE family protein [Alteromonadaceae bacterium BrNp21-10]